MVQIHALLLLAALTEALAAPHDLADTGGSVEARGNTVGGTSELAGETSEFGQSPEEIAEILKQAPAPVPLGGHFRVELHMCLDTNCKDDGGARRPVTFTTHLPFGEFDCQRVPPPRQEGGGAGGAGGAGVRSARFGRMKGDAICTANFYKNDSCDRNNFLGQAVVEGDGVEGACSGALVPDAAMYQVQCGKATRSTASDRKEPGKEDPTPWEGEPV